MCLSRTLAQYKTASSLWDIPVGDVAIVEEAQSCSQPDAWSVPRLARKDELLQLLAGALRERDLELQRIINVMEETV